MVYMANLLLRAKCVKGADSALEDRHFNQFSSKTILQETFLPFYVVCYNLFCERIKWLVLSITCVPDLITLLYTIKSDHKAKGKAQTVSPNSHGIFIITIRFRKILIKPVVVLKQHRTVLPPLKHS